MKKNKYEEIIAVDGGLAFAAEAGLKITHLVGDFDTIDPEILKNFLHREDICVHQFIPEKDYTDTDIAMKLAMEILEKQTGREQSIFSVVREAVWIMYWPISRC